ncbi:hypothetical protein [Pseudomonas sp.]|uniref:hypothetical protein n=1 Tax=Pseudomonas sp. TaxID=306 RepID=UPI003D0B9760
MDGIEDRLSKMVNIIMFLSDILTQPTPVNCPSVELSEEGRNGLGMMLRDLGLEAKQLCSDVEEMIIKWKHAEPVK